MTTNLPATIDKLPVIKSGDDLNRLVHGVFTPDKFNVLVPKAMNISPRVAVAIEVVNLDGNPNLRENRSFWSIDGNECILSAKSIRQLSTAANVQWIPALTGVVGEPKYDDGGRLLRLRYKAVGQVITPKGVNRQGSGEYEYNYAEDKNNPSLKPTQVAQRRRFGLQLAETGAKNRAFFDMLGMVEKSYAKNDIGKPFIVPCVVDDINYDDPAIKRLIAERALGATQGVFGKNAVNAEYEVDTSTGEVKTNTQKSSSQQSKPIKENDSEQPPEMPEESQPDPRVVFKNNWNSTSPGARGAEIQRLAQKTGYDISKGKNNKPLEPPEKWPEKIQMAWLFFLAEKAGEIPAEQK